MLRAPGCRVLRFAGRADHYSFIMDQLPALVRLPYVTGGPIKVGTVIKQEDDLYTVKWDDTGAEQEVHLGDYEKVTVRESLEFQSLTDPDGLRAAFEQDPPAVALRFLQESAATMTGKELKLALTGFGIDDARFRGAWTSIRKQLMTDPRLVVAGTGAGTTFAWRDAGSSD